MLILQGITYAHPNKDILFDDINIVVNNYEKIALIGNNGAGKSTLLKIMAGALQPLNGVVSADTRPYYIPQIFGQYSHYTIMQALGVENKLNALNEILDGNVTAANMTILDDDWTIEERCKEALAYWQLQEVDLRKKMETLSGGEKTKVFLAGITIHKPQIVLLDEPSNHLDAPGRELLYNYIDAANQTLVVVSHDRTLLNLLPTVYELGKKGINVYGGNYDFYTAQKTAENNAFNQGLKSKEKELRKARETERAAMEQQQKLDARGKKKQEKAGLPTISMNTFRNNAEKSTARIKGVHADKTEAISKELDALRKEQPDADKIKVGFGHSVLHKGKILIKTTDINLAYNGQMLWQQPLSFVVESGERIVIKGRNGAGKTTLIKILLGHILPTIGNIERADTTAIYIDQDYSLINNGLTVYEQVQQFNTGKLEQHELKSRLTHFLFTTAYWDKRCETLSGGEKMRLMLCCLTVGVHAPDIIVLDEPTNNLDIQNIEILTSAVNGYKGTVIVISHDAWFLEQINVGRIIEL